MRRTTQCFCSHLYGFFPPQQGSLGSRGVSQIRRPSVKLFRFYRDRAFLSWAWTLTCLGWQGGTPQRDLPLKYLKACPPRGQATGLWDGMTRDGWAVMMGVRDWAEEENSEHGGKWKHNKMQVWRHKKRGKKEKLLVSENFYSEAGIALVMQQKRHTEIDIPLCFTSSQLVYSSGLRKEPITTVLFLGCRELCTFEL